MTRHLRRLVPPAASGLSSRADASTLRRSRRRRRRSHLSLRAPGSMLASRPGSILASAEGSKIRTAFGGCIDADEDRCLLRGTPFAHGHRLHDWRDDRSHRRRAHGARACSSNRRSPSGASIKVHYTLITGSAVNQAASGSDERSARSASASGARGSQPARGMLYRFPRATRQYSDMLACVRGASRVTAK